MAVPAIVTMTHTGYHLIVKGVTIIGCEVLGDEIRALAPHCDTVLLPGRLHFRGEELREALAEKIRAVPAGETVLLAYGRCAISGGRLAAGSHRLVVPAVDNCVALLLGSGSTYHREMKRHPNTLYYTRGWTEGMDDPYRMYVQAIERLGEDAARRWAELLFANYSRVALVETDDLPMDQCRHYVTLVGTSSGLPVETVRGSLRLLEKLVRGSHDEDFIVVEPFGTLDDSTFWRRDRRQSPEPEEDLQPVHS